MIKNVLFSSGQVVSLASGEDYTIKGDEVFINDHPYKKADLEIGLSNVYHIDPLEDPLSIKVAVYSKRTNTTHETAHLVNYLEWEIDGVVPSSLVECVELINLAICVDVLDKILEAIEETNDILEEQTTLLEEIRDSNVLQEGLINETNTLIEDVKIKLDILHSDNDITNQELADANTSLDTISTTLNDIKLEDESFHADILSVSNDIKTVLESVDANTDELEPKIDALILFNDEVETILNNINDSINSGTVLTVTKLEELKTILSSIDVNTAELESKLVSIIAEHDQTQVLIGQSNLHLEGIKNKPEATELAICFGGSDLYENQEVRSFKEPNALVGGQPYIQPEDYVVVRAFKYISTDYFLFPSNSSSLSGFSYPSSLGDAIVYKDSNEVYPDFYEFAENFYNIFENRTGLTLPHFSTWYRDDADKSKFYIPNLNDGSYTADVTKLYAIDTFSAKEGGGRDLQSAFDRQDETISYEIGGEGYNSGSIVKEFDANGDEIIANRKFYQSGIEISEPATWVEGDCVQYKISDLITNVSEGNTTLNEIKDKLNADCTTPIKVEVCNQSPPLDLSGIQASLVEISDKLSLSNDKLDSIDENTDGVKEKIDLVISKVETTNTLISEGNSSLTVINSSINDVTTSLGSTIPLLQAIGENTDEIENLITDVSTKIEEVKAVLQAEFDETQVLIGQSNLFLEDLKLKPNQTEILICSSFEITELDKEIPTHGLYGFLFNFPVPTTPTTDLTFRKTGSTVPLILAGEDIVTLSLETLRVRVIEAFNEHGYNFTESSVKVIRQAGNIGIISDMPYTPFTDFFVEVSTGIVPQIFLTHSNDQFYITKTCSLVKEYDDVGNEIVASRKFYSQGIEIATPLNWNEGSCPVPIVESAEGVNLDLLLDGNTPFQQDLIALSETYSDFQSLTFTVYDGTAIVSIDGSPVNFPLIGTNGNVLGATWTAEQVGNKPITIDATNGKVYVTTISL